MRGYDERRRLSVERERVPNMLIKILEDGTQVAIPGTNSNRVRYIIEKKKEAPKEVLKIIPKVEAIPVKSESEKPKVTPKVEAIPVKPEEEPETEMIPEEGLSDNWFPALKELKGMLKADLEKLAKEYNLSSKGVKPVLRSRLITYAEENGLFERW